MQVNLRLPIMLKHKHMSLNTKHKRVFLIWLAIYPLITVLFLLLGDYLARFPLMVRTLILTLIAVPIAAYIILPFYNRVFHKWLNNEHSIASIQSVTRQSN